MENSKSSGADVGRCSWFGQMISSVCGSIQHENQTKSDGLKKKPLYAVQLNPISTQIFERSDVVMAHLFQFLRALTLIPEILQT